MKMKKIVGLFFLFSLCSVELSGQIYVPKSNQEIGYAYIDCSDMPAGAVTEVKKENATVANDVNGPRAGLGDLCSRESDAKVYRKFAISPRDSGAAMTFAEAFDYCKNTVSVPGWDFRLPTARELALIFMFRDELAADGIGLSNNSYVSATNLSAISVATLSFYSSRYNSGVAEPVGLSSPYVSSVNSKKYKYFVRCIHDLNLP